jgi:hypothetical protein
MLRAIFHPVGREFTPLESFPHIEGEREKRWKKASMATIHPVVAAMRHPTKKKTPQ